MFKTPEDRLSEIELYELVAEEIENNQQSKGLWVKALSDSGGDLDKGQALYVKLRVQMIKDEWAHLDNVRIEQEKARQAEAELVQRPEVIEQEIAAERSRLRKKPIHRKKAKFAFRAMLFFVVLFGVSVGGIAFFDGMVSKNIEPFQVILVISIVGAPLMLLKYFYHSILGAPRGTWSS
jgi:hypothetical protein